MSIFGIAIGYSLAWKALATLFIAVLPIRVTTGAGDTVKGNLAGLTKTELLIDRDGEAMTLSFDSLATLQPVEVDEKVGPTMCVTLLGGSKIAAQDLSLADDTLVIEPRRQQAIRVNVKQVKSIRFRAPSRATDPQWLGLQEQQGRGDILAIRRDGDRMDPYRGVVQSIADGKVDFDMEDQPVAAPIDKLEGVIFGGNQDVNENAVIKVTDVYGSTWAAVEALPSSGDQPLRLKLDESTIHEIPLRHISTISWSSGLQLLATVEAAEHSYKPFFASNLDPAELVQWFGPVRDGESDLRLQGNSSIEYRVQPGFTRLAGSVRRDESISKAGAVTVSILIDDQVQWKEQIKGSSRLGFDLPVGNARRVRIEVDSGEDGDLGDTVRITRPRLVK